jgi:short-subunit dehydrogenase
MVAGGTGMLRDVSLFLASKGYIVTVIARDAQRLSTLVEEAESVEGFIHPAHSINISRLHITK